MSTSWHGPGASTPDLGITELRRGIGRANATQVKALWAGRLDGVHCALLRARWPLLRAHRH